MRRIILLALPLVLCAGPAGAGPADLLAEAIRFETVSNQDRSLFDADAFEAHNAFLRRAFPRVHASLELHRISEWSLLFVWKGREAAASPILLTSHFDVVPPGELASWTHPPFAGVIAEGYVWGRGALDDKAGVIGMLAAAEQLLADGFQPRRTVYLAFGHDEEIGGDEGAGATARWLDERGVRVRFSLDEGMAILDDAFPGLERPVALIGVAEKGYLTVELVARAVGGHSSTPPPNTAIGQLARAIQRVEENPLPARMGVVVGGLLDTVAPHLPFVPRIAMQNRWLVGGMIESRMEAQPATNAMIRTTTAVTMVRGGVKENVLPPQARATVNFRIAPGDTSDEVIGHIRRVVFETGVEVEVDRATEPSPVADVESAAYALIRDSIEEVAPGTLVAPGLVVGGTDSKHYAPIAENSFRFTPFRLSAADVPRIHGVDERIAVDNFEDEVVPFYVELLRSADELAGD